MQGTRSGCQEGMCEVTSLQLLFIDVLLSPVCCFLSAVPCLLSLGCLLSVVMIGLFLTVQGDVFSFGMTLSELMTFSPPFQNNREQMDVAGIQSALWRGDRPSFSVKVV